ncbi:Uncharacterised protein [uncultured archaeon]|nr:Uncharacterised protein [uncultured archaeon]
MNGFRKFIKDHERLSLFALFYIIYILNTRTIGAGDTIPASLLPFCILENHNLYFDIFYPYFSNSYPYVWFLMQAKGHYLSLYPIVTPLIITPLYILPYFFLKLLHYPIDISNPGFMQVVLLLEKLIASLIAALSGVFVFMSLKELINIRVATIVAVVFAFGTNTWTISSQALWQHGMVELLLSIILYVVIINEKRATNINIVILGILSGLFTFNRPIDSILLIPLIYYILDKKDQRIIYYFVSMLLISLPLTIYNFYYFGNLFGGYTGLLSQFSLNSATPFNFVGLLLSPSRGLLVYTPIILGSVLGYHELSKLSTSKTRNFLLMFGPVVILQIISYSLFRTWWAGWSYGPRFLTGMLPVLMVFLGYCLKDYFESSKLNKRDMLFLSLLSVLLVWSIFVQVVGAFYYDPNFGWDGDPNIDSHPERLWELSNNQIIRSFNSGPIVKDPFGNIYIIIMHSKDILSYDNVEPMEVNTSIGDNWYELEYWNEVPTRWMRNDATLRFDLCENRTALLSLDAFSFKLNRTLTILSDGKPIAIESISNTHFTPVKAPIRLNKGTNTIILAVKEGCSDSGTGNMPGKCLSVAIQNIKLFGTS